MSCVIFDDSNSLFCDDDVKSIPPTRHSKDYQSERFAIKSGSRIGKPNVSPIQEESKSKSRSNSKAFVDLSASRSPPVSDVSRKSNSERKDPIQNVKSNKKVARDKQIDDATHDKKHGDLTRDDKKRGDVSGKKSCKQNDGRLKNGNSDNRNKQDLIENKQNAIESKHSRKEELYGENEANNITKEGLEESKLSQEYIRQTVVKENFDYQNEILRLQRKMSKLQSKISELQKRVLNLQGKV